MEVVSNHLFKNLIGQTVTAVSRLALKSSTNTQTLMDTLVLTLSDGRYFEFIGGQANFRLAEILDESKFIADFELEPGETLKLSHLKAKNLNKSFVIAGVTEVWAGEGETRFLVAVIFSDENRKPLLSICTETDELEIMSVKALRSRIEEMPFYYGSVQHLWYAEHPQNQSPDYAALATLPS